MTVITLIRHGQANFGATTEEGYDQLSALGHQQAEWLGAYLRSAGDRYDYIHCGTLRRHRETVASMGIGQPVEDARLNEMQYLNMAEAFNAQSGMSMPQSGPEFAAHVPHLFRAWAAGDLDHVHTPYAIFGQRMDSKVKEALVMGGRHIFITSGGVIGMMIARLMGLGSDGFAQIMLPIRNTSVHRFGLEGANLYLDSYNATPHLDMEHRAHARTFV